MGQGGHLRNEIDVVRPSPLGQVSNLSLFQNSAVRNILVGRILILAMGTSGTVSPAVAEILEEVDPSGVHFGMPVQTHGAVDFDDELVVLVQRHEIPHESLEKGDMVAAGKIDLHAAKRLIGPVFDSHTRNTQSGLRSADQLSQGLQTIEGAPVVATNHYHRISIRVEHVALAARIRRCHGQTVFRTILLYQGVGDGSHQNVSSGGRQSRGSFDAHIEAMPVAQIGCQFAHQQDVVFRGRCRHNDANRFLEREPRPVQLHLPGDRKNQRIERRSGRTAAGE